MDIDNFEVLLPSSKSKNIIFEKSDLISKFLL